jgi:hypothetical protein
MDTGGFLFGVKLSLSSHLLGARRSLELFQSLKEGCRGCLGPDGRWLPDGVFYRKTLTVGRIKLFLAEGYVERVKLVCGENDGGS